MAYKLEIPDKTQYQIDKNVLYIINVLQNKPAAISVLNDIEFAYN